MWYDNPTIAAVLGGVAGALLASILGFFTAVRVAKRQAALTKKIHRIECFIRQAASLMSFSETIRDRIAVSIDDQEVSSVYLFTVDIVNTGTEPVKDQPVKIRLGETSQIVSYTLATEPAVGFGSVQQELVDAGLDLKIDLMNRDDRVSLSIMSHNNPNDTIEIFLKNEGVDTAVYRGGERAKISDQLLSHEFLTATALMGSIPFIGWMFRGFAQLALIQKLDELSQDLKRIAENK